MGYIGNRPILSTYERGLDGDSCFIRYSAHADGTDFTETWAIDKTYIGFYVGQEASTDKADYTWARFTVGEDNVQVDWNQTDATADDYIKNKPTIDTAMSADSTNAVQNRVIKQYIDDAISAAITTALNTEV